MRIYLILSECPALQDSKNYISLTIPLAMAILRLDANPSKVLGMHIFHCLETLFIAWLESLSEFKIEGAFEMNLILVSQITGGL